MDLGGVEHACKHLPCVAGHDEGARERAEWPPYGVVQVQHGVGGDGLRSGDLPVGGGAQPQVAVPHQHEERHRVRAADRHIHAAYPGTAQGMRASRHARI